jgi:hypothetical protein
VSPELVVVRRAGALWGVPAAAVAAIERGPEGVTVRLAGGRELGAEAVVGLSGEVSVRGLAPPVRRRLPPAVAGLALWNSEPVAVLGVAAAPAGGRR